jgi:hypothetical protein
VGVKGDPQCCYFVCDQRRRYVKIGITTNMDKRLRALNGGSPFPLRVDLSLHFTGDGAYRYEDALHQMFAAHWRQGEWFDYAKPIKDFVAAWNAGETPAVPLPALSCKEYTHQTGFDRFEDRFGHSFTKAEVMALLKARAV